MLRAALLMLALATAGCAVPGGGQKHAAAAGHKFELLSLPYPSAVSGYDAATEKDSAKTLGTGGADSLLDGGQVVSFRRNKQLFATLEIGRLVPDLNAGDRSVQDQIVGQVGSTILRPVAVKGRTVWEGQGNRQLVYVWFKGKLMHVLLTHDIADPTPLLNDVLDQA